MSTFASIKNEKTVSFQIVTRPLFETCGAGGVYIPATAKWTVEDRKNISRKKMNE